MLVEIENISDVNFQFRVNDGQLIENNPNIFSVLPHGVTKIEIGNSKSTKVNLGLDMLNAFIRPNIHPQIVLSN